MPNPFEVGVIHLVRAYLNYKIWIRNPKEAAPDVVKAYPVRPQLKNNHIFFPSKTKDASKKPLIIDVHGGGWLIGNPGDDDQMCRYLADRCGAVVVSLNYSLAPQHPFPTALDDIVALFQAVLNDEELGIDVNKVAIMGDSAGGNLVLAASQNETVKSKVKALVALYPVTDGVTSLEDKWKQRLKDYPDDRLYKSHDLIFNFYAPRGTVSRDDPRLSPICAERSTLPEKIYVVGCEEDLLCAEDKRFAEKLVPEVSERRETEYGWETDTVRWDLYKDQAHAFDHERVRDATKEAARQAATEVLYGRIAEWLIEKAF